MNRLNALKLIYGFIGITILAACGGTAPVAEPSKPRFDQVLRVEIGGTDRREALERVLGGEVVVWNPQASFALLGLEAGMRPGALSTSEPNGRVFLASGRTAWMNGQSSLWAGGQSSLWASGQSSLWAGGQSSLWASGTFRLFPQNTDPWKQINLENAQALASNLGRGVKVAVIDTGVDLAHPMISSSLVPAHERWDFVGNDPVPQEEGSLGVGGFGHGTNVAGIVLQIAPAARIMPLRVLGPDGRGEVLHLAAAIDFAMRNGARVINLSLGSNTVSPAVESAIQAAAARGILVVSSAGNLGTTAVSYPASQANLEAGGGYQRLSVTSIQGDFQKSGFASYGGSVEVAAPGEGIFGPAPGGRVAAWSGTSMAAPMASGALALALGQTLAVPAEMLADALQETSNGEIYNNATNEIYKDQVGKGSLDLEAFLENVVTR